MPCSSHSFFCSADVRIFEFIILGKSLQCNECRLFRAWTLWDKNKAIGAILVCSWLSAVGTCIVVVRSDLNASQHYPRIQRSTANLRFQPIPGVIPLPPMWFLPCDRPSPYKYLVEVWDFFILHLLVLTLFSDQYIIALIIELISLSFMMGRISYLAMKSKKSRRAERAREGNGARVLRALRRQ